MPPKQQKTRDIRHQPSGDSDTQQGGASGNQPGRASGNQPGRASGNQPGRASGNQPGRASGNQPGRASGNQPGRASGNQPGGASGNQPGRASGNQPGRASGNQPGRASGNQPGRASGNQPGRASGNQPGRASGNQPGRASGNQPGGASGNQPGRASGNQPGAASGRKASGAPPLKTFTGSQVKKEDDDGSTDHDSHQLNVKFYPDKTSEYVLFCSEPCTVLEVIKSSEEYKNRMKTVSDENIVIQWGKEDREIVVATHFPCTLLNNDDFLVLSCESESVEAAHDQNDGIIHSSNKYSVFYIDTIGGKDTKTKRLFRSSALKKFKYLCVYAERGMTVEEALKRDGRFIDDLGNFTLSHNNDPNRITEHTQKVDSLDQKRFKLCLSSKRISEETQASKAEGRLSTVVGEHREPISVKTAMEKKTTHEVEEIYEILRRQFSQLKELMKSRFPGDSYEKTLSLRKEDFGKIQQLFADVNRIRKTLKLGDSVCKIIVPNFVEGTGFVLLDNYILTNAHLFNSLCEGERLMEGLNVSVLFNYEEPEPHDIFKLADNNFFLCDNELDYAILELKPEGQKLHQTVEAKKVKVPPGLLKHFGPKPECGEACLIGHPGGEVKKLDPTCIIEKEERVQAVSDSINQRKEAFIVHPIFYNLQSQGIEKIMVGGECEDKVITYNTFMYHKSSGSPVFDAHGRVFGLHSGGFFYDQSSVIEFAHPLLPIFEHFVMKLRKLGNETLLREIQKQSKDNKYLREALSSRTTDANECSDSEEPMDTQ